MAENKTYPKRANAWAHTFEELVNKVVDAAGGIEGVEAETDANEGRIHITGTWVPGDRDDHHRAWDTFKNVSQCLKANRIWTDYDLNTTPSEGDGTWEIVVDWHVQQ